jgi:hypothetical protein
MFNGGLNKGEKIAHHHIPIQLPSVDVAPDPPIFSLVTTFKMKKSGHILQQNYILLLFLNRHFQIVARGFYSIAV